jgi:hypothetical protein
LYLYYPIFHCGYHCRGAYTAERLIFHDSFSEGYNLKRVFSKPSGKSVVAPIFCFLS